MTDTKSTLPQGGGSYTRSKTDGALTCVVAPPKPPKVRPPKVRGAPETLDSAAADTPKTKERK